jgi:hypothetical protein
MLMVIPSRRKMKPMVLGNHPHDGLQMRRQNVANDSLEICQRCGPTLGVFQGKPRSLQNIGEKPHTKVNKGETKSVQPPIRRIEKGVYIEREGGRGDLQEGEERKSQREKRDWRGDLVLKVEKLQILVLCASNLLFHHILVAFFHTLVCSHQI